ncbi:hypothetical protein INR49_010194 [Caranx melampygus]|nr:hypothetical protein INR49_010194 [Caranx melampygus]
MYEKRSTVTPMKANHDNRDLFRAHYRRRRRHHHALFSSPCDNEMQQILSSEQTLERDEPRPDSSSVLLFISLSPPHPKIFDYE